MVLDTLFADMDRETVTLTWRGLVDVLSDDLHEVRAVLIDAQAQGEAEAPASRYEAALDAFERDPLGVDRHMPEPLRPLAKR